MNDQSSYDVVVVGGGPGGSALATFLAKSGWNCLVLEGSKFPRYHIGESLIPHTYGVFDRLGLLPKLRESVFPVKQSVRFVNRDGSQSYPFYFSETIPDERAATWQVERSEFDEIMLNHARENGVEVREGCHVNRVLFDRGRAVGVEANCGDPKNASRNFDARVVVDASGRSTVIGKQLGLRGPVPGLRKGSAWAYYSGGERLKGIDAGETTIFKLSDDAWFWYIPLPNDIVSVGIVCDPERIFDGDGRMEDDFLRQVAECPTLASRLRHAKRIGPVRGMREMSYLNRQTCGDGWVMIGDARAFLDPIYSSGLYLALGSAELAAQCIHRALEDDDVTAARLGRFEPMLLEGVEVIRGLIHAFYDPNFSFQRFSERFPQQRAALIDCLVGDVLKDMRSFREALAEMTPPPNPFAA
jgi:flavin-dependent dehydrogenase